jgi:hypothetical protein
MATKLSFKNGTASYTESSKCYTLTVHHNTGGSGRWKWTDEQRMLDYAKGLDKKTTVISNAARKNFAKAFLSAPQSKAYAKSRRVAKNKVTRADVLQAIANLINAQ